MIEKYLRNKTIMSAAGIVIGLILMIWQKSVLITLVRVMGYVMIAAAAVYLVMYLKNNRQNDAELGYAIAGAGAGLLLVLLCRTIVNIFPVLMGIFLILSGAAALFKSFDDSNVPVYSKLIAALVILLGIMIVLQPGWIVNSIVFCIGAALVVNGISGLLMSRQI